jgi:hypothetical protein
MSKIRQQATEDLAKKVEHFMAFLRSFQDGRNIDHFNPSSTLQLQQLLFAPCEVVPPPKDKKVESNLSR